MLGLLALGPLFLAKLEIESSEKIVWFVVMGPSLLWAILRPVATWLRRAKKPNKAEKRERPLFDRILGDSGFAPLKDKKEDELEREVLIDALYDLIAEPRSLSMTFGLEGAWGSGKTSLLSLLRDRLEAVGITVLAFDAWSYREPERLVRVFFDRLAGALRRVRPSLESGRLVRRLGAGLAELGKVAKASEAIFGDLSAESLQHTKEKLHAALEELDRPLILFVDDLDRLDRDELVAVLRSVRLVSDLPNLTQVLAYDRTQLASTLFPNDETGSRARDHLGKVVNCELSIGTPPTDLVERLLSRALEPFIESLGGSAELFQDPESRSLNLAEALPTPRVMRQVVASTAWLWERMAGNLNPRDLFVLTILQYRFPMTYAMVRAHADWFVELKWSDDPYIAIVDPERDALREKGENYLKDLRGKNSREERVAAELLDLLFPNLRSGVEFGQPDEETARRERRIYHPGIVNRYFHLYIPKHTISEQEFEEYADRIKAAEPGEPRQQMLHETIETEASKNRLDSFLDQWDLVFRRDPGVQRFDKELVWDLALGFAKATDHFSAESGLGGSQLSLAAYKVLFLSYHLREERCATELLETVIRRSDSLGFAGTIIRNSSKDQLPVGYQECPTPDTQQLESILASKVVKRYAADPTSLLSLPAQDLGDALFSTGDDSPVGPLVLQALQAHPELLPRILVLAIHIWNSKFGDTIDVNQERLKKIDQRLDLQKIHAATEHLSLESWSEEREQTLVKLFRDLLSSANAEGRGA